MRILLTGHHGFIGRALFKKLKKSHDVIGLDIKDNNDLLTCPLPWHVDLVIHLAGLSGVRESINDPAGYWFNNVEASRRLFERYHNNRILYASSSAAYEPDLNPYAASKYIMEELAGRYPNTLGMRIHTVYSDTPRKNMFIDKLLTKKLEYTTTHYRDFIHLEDVIDAIEILIAKTHVKGIVDIGTGTPIRISNLAPDLPIRLNTPNERQWTCANIDQLKNLGFTPKHNIEKFLTNTNLECIIK